MPKVSVIIPVYGVEKYIERCALSLFKQSLDDIEFIFIDDCTPDRSIEILSHIIEKNRSSIAEMRWTVRIEKMPVNSGLPAVRRHGLQMATGQFVIACDSDDYIESDMYKDMYDYAITNSCDFVHCDIDVVDGNKVLYNLTYKDSNIGSDELRRLIIDGEISNSLCNKLVKKELYTEKEIIYPVQNMDEDNVVAIQLAANAQKLGYIKKTYYHAFLNMESISRKVDKDQILKRYKDSLINSKIIIDYLFLLGYDNNSQAVIKAKLRPKMVLFPILNNYENITLWKNTYPEVNGVILFNKRFSLRARLKAFLAYFYLFPVISPIYKLFKYIFK